MVDLVKLGDVCTVVSGSTPKTSVDEYWNGNVKWITPAELDSDSYYVYDTVKHISELGRTKTGLSYMPEGTVILSSRAPIGKTAIAGCEMCCNQGFKNLICSDRILNKYLFFFLRSKTEFLNSLGRGATFKELSKSIVENVEIPLPPIEEQTKISEKFICIDNQLHLRKQQLKKLDELIKSRFIEMFGELGTDVKGWGLSRLGDCCVINPKKGEDKRLRENLTVSFVPMPCVSENGEIDASEIRSYSDVKSGFTYFAENDVLFAKITPCMENGKGAVAKGLFNGIGFGSTEFHVLRPVNGISNPYWIYVLTAFNQFRVDATSNMTGSAGQRRVPASFLDAYKISLPPIDLQNKFATFVEQTIKLKFEVKESLEKLETLKKSLMQEYFG